MDLIRFASAVWNRLSTKVEFQDPIVASINLETIEFSAWTDIGDVTLPSPLPGNQILHLAPLPILHLAPLAMIFSAFTILFQAKDPEPALASKIEL